MLTKDPVMEPEGKVVGYERDGAAERTTCPQYDIKGTWSLHYTLITQGIRSAVSKECHFFASLNTDLTRSRPRTKMNILLETVLPHLVLISHFLPLRFFLS